MASQEVGFSQMIVEALQQVIDINTEGGNAELTLESSHLQRALAGTCFIRKPGKFNYRPRYNGSKGSEYKLDS